MNDKLLTVDELAEKLNLPRSWIYGKTRLKDDNQIPVIRCGKYCRFDYQQVIAWLKEKSGAEY